MNVPARYCAGYLRDICVPPDPAPMDFSAWFEVYLGDRWYSTPATTLPRIGRILLARGRDATDVAITTSSGPHELGVHRRGGFGRDARLSWRRRGQFLTPFCQVRPKAIAAATAACQGTNS